MTDILFLLKAGFIGFALCLGVQMLVFYSAGKFFRLSQRNFMRFFVIAGLITFFVLDLFLYYKITVEQVPNPEIFLAGSIGGWFGGIISGLTHMKKFLLKMAG